MKTELIPSYHIFGEPVDEACFAFVHVERVRDRAWLHDGSVRAHRHAHLDQLALWHNGGGWLTIDGERHAIPASALTIVPAGVVHGFEIPEATDATVVSFSPQFITSPSADARNGFLASCASPRVQPLGGVIQQRFAHLFGEIEREHRERRTHATDAIAACLKLVLVALARLQPDPSGADATDPLLERFTHLLEERFTERWHVSRYVVELCTTAYLLNRSTRMRFDMTPSAMIERRLLIEAKRLLCYTPATVGEIAVALGHDDSAHFVRMFRRSVGQSPAAWRAERRTRTPLNDRTRQKSAQDPQSPR